MKRPGLVSGVVALGAPLLDPFAIHPFVRLQVEAVGALGGFGVPGLFGRSCLDGDCCSEFWQRSHGPLPGDVGFVSVYSRSDGVVDWRACRDPHAGHVEVDASHIGMSLSAPVYRAGRRRARRLPSPLYPPRRGGGRARRRRLTAAGPARPSRRGSVCRSACTLRLGCLVLLDCFGQHLTPKPTPAPSAREP